MNKLYRLDFQDLEFWKLKEDENTKEKYYEKVKESGSFCLNKTETFTSDGRICNYEDVTSHQPIRIRTLDESYVIEPSNIVIPRKNMKRILSTDGITDTDHILFRNISIDTFICNLISDFTRGGKKIIPEEEVELLRKKIITNIAALTNIKSNNNYLSSTDFVFIFSLFLFSNNIDSFENEDLMNYIFTNQDNPEYQSILGQTKVYRSEHYDVSPDLEFGFACLKYIGIIHPDYKHNFLEVYYSYLGIDPSILEFISLYNKKRLQFPEMKKFLNNYTKNIGNHFILSIINKNRRLNNN